jgi:hypothetical protein
MPDLIEPESKSDLPPIPNQTILQIEGFTIQLPRLNNVPEGFFNKEAFELKTPRFFERGDNSEI